ncbi:MAG: hypothetical protein QXG48_02870 [Thermofilaceae archaeon]
MEAWRQLHFVKREPAGSMRGSELNAFNFTLLSSNLRIVATERTAAIFAQRCLRSAGARAAIEYGFNASRGGAEEPERRRDYLLEVTGTCDPRSNVARAGRLPIEDGRSC